MLFEVVGAMHTTSIECVPFDQLNELASAGFKFKVDGKLVTKNNVKAAVEASCKGSVPDIPKLQPTSSKGVRCITTGEVFKNQAEAARAYKIDPAQVSDSIKTGRPRSGYVFERC